MIIPAAENMHLSQDENGVLIPLEFNSNDKGSLFAGSIYSGAVIAGYRRAEQLLASLKIKGTLVAKETRIRYLKQILSDGLAVAEIEDQPVRKPNGNYMINIKVVVNNPEGIACAEMEAEFILLVPR